MRRQTKKIAIGILTAGLVLAGISNAGMSYVKANTVTGSSITLTTVNDDVKDMLTRAIETEYLAEAQYEAIMDKFGEQRPFSNYVRAESTHINLLLSLLEEYGITAPSKNWDDLVAAPDTLAASYEAVLNAEETTIDMYEEYLKQDLPADIEDVFQYLLDASKHHLQSCQNVIDGTCTSTSMNRGGGLGNSSRGKGQGSRGCGVYNSNLY